MISTEETLTEFQTQNTEHFNPNNFRDHLCHCRDITEDDLIDGIHTECGGKRIEEITSKRKRKK